MATQKTHPKEWDDFLLMCDKQEYDNPLFKHYQDMFFSGPRTKMKPVKPLGRIKPIKVTKPDGSTEIHMGRNKLAEKLQINKNYISVQNGKIIQRGKLKGWRFDVMPRPIPVYALYEEDDLLGIGTPEELCKNHDITLSTLEFYYYQKSRPGTNRRALLVDWEYPGLEAEAQ